MGRTTILGRPLIDKIVETVRELGLPPTAAGELYGVSAGTVSEWLRRGEDRDARPNNEIYAAFAAEIRRAEALRMGMLVNRVEIAGDNGSWQAAAWLLERRWPGIWGRHRPAAAPTVTIELVFQLTQNVLALGADVEPLQLAEQIAQVLGLASGDALTQAFKAPARALLPIVNTSAIGAPKASHALRARYRTVTERPPARNLYANDPAPVLPAVHRAGDAALAPLIRACEPGFMELTDGY